MSEVFYECRCTGAFVGKNVSLEGHRIIARSEDTRNGVSGKLFTVVPSTRNKYRSLIDKGVLARGFSLPLPEKTCRYTKLVNFSCHEDGEYPASCMNEYGLAVTATVTTYVSDEYKAIDPLKPLHKGLRESILAELIACQANSARDAVKVLSRYLNTYGSSEYNTCLFSDKKEAWIFEIYGANSWCAKKLSDDCVAVFGNEIMIDWVDFKNPSTDVLYSENLFENLNQMKNRIKDEKGRIHLSATIKGMKREDFAHMRTFRGRQLWAPASVDKYSDEEIYPLEFIPEKKISVLDVMDLYRDRYDNTIYATDIKGNEANYPIGTYRSKNIHIIETWDELPDDTCQCQWLCLGDAVGSLFIPAFSGIKETFEKYREDVKEDGIITDNFYFACRRNASLAETDRKNLLRGLQFINRGSEKRMKEEITRLIPAIRLQYALSKEDGQAYVTALSKRIAKTQYEEIEKIYKQLAYIQMYNNTGDHFKESPITFTPDLLK